MSDAMRSRFRRFPEVICVDSRARVNKPQQLVYTSPVGIDGGLKSFRISLGLVSGEGESEVTFIHEATRFLASDTAGTPYFQATRLLISDTPPSIAHTPRRLSPPEDTQTGAAGNEHVCVGSWSVNCVMLFRLLLSVVFLVRCF